MAQLVPTIPPVPGTVIPTSRGPVTLPPTIPPAPGHWGPYMTGQEETEAIERIVGGSVTGPRLVELPVAGPGGGVRTTPMDWRRGLLPPDPLLSRRPYAPVTDGARRPGHSFVARLDSVPLSAASHSDVLHRGSVPLPAASVTGGTRRSGHSFATRRDSVPLPAASHFRSLWPRLRTSTRRTCYRCPLRKVWPV